MRFTTLLIGLLMCFSVPTWGAELKYNVQEYEDQRAYQDDYVFMGETLTFTGSAWDLFFLGKRLVFSGLAEQGIVAAGETIDLTGPINDGIMSVGRTIHVDAPVTGSVFMAGEELVLGARSSIKGSLFSASRSLDIEGPIEGDIHAAAAEIRVANEVHGNVTVNAGRLSLADNARVNGNLTYYADYEISEEEASRVTGTITFSKQKDNGHFHSLAEKRSFEKPWWISLALFLSFVITGLIILLIPVARSLNDRISNREFWMGALWGLIPIFVYPTVILLFIMMLITIPLSIAMILAGFPLFVVTIVLGSIIVGRQLFELLGLRSKNRFLYFLLGALIYSLLTLAPILNLVVTIFVSSLGWGRLLSGFFGKRFS